MHSPSFRWPKRLSFATFAALGLLLWASGLRAQILVNEFVAGGDGREGSADPTFVGISSDTGLFELQHQNGNITNTGDNPQAVDPVNTSPFINAVFIIDNPLMPISTDGIAFQFGAGDATGDTWNHIIKDATHDIDKNCADIPSGGINFQRAIGIHASAGITFDLVEIRDEHGEDQVKFFSSFAGMDRCGGEINLYAIVSNEDEILGSARVGPINANQGEFMQLAIPDAATYLTLATGGSNGSIGCAHGVFADPLISGAEISLPDRTATASGDADACPPSSGGPISVTITQAGGGAQMITVTENAIGPFAKEDVTAPGATIADNAPDGISDDLTFLNAWLLLGPYGQFGGATPGEDNMRLDYLTDGQNIEELSVEPEPGDTVNTDYNGAAASTELLVFGGGINPAGIPTWAAWVDNDSTINFDDYYGGNQDNLMMYAVTYIQVGDQSLQADLVLSTDDAVHVLFGEVGDLAAELWINNVARGLGGPCATPDTAPLGTLAANTTYKIMLKIFEGGGGNGFRARLVDPLNGDPLSEGFTVSLDPDDPDFAFPPNGVEITWNVSRDTLADPGLSYEIDIDGGIVSFSGDAGGASILGTGTFTLIQAQHDFGPFADPPFAHAHGIGVACSGTEVTNPSAGEIVITGAGADIWNQADQFMYAYSEQTGDFSATVTITDRVLGNNVWAKHGIMARVNCSAGSPYIYVSDQQSLLDGPNPPALQWRDVQDAAAAWDGATLPGGVHADVLRLDRCGNTFTGYVLDEFGDIGGTPGEWVEVNRRTWPEDTPDTLQLGLAVTSHDGCNLITVTFEDWEVLDSCPGPVQDLVCTQNAAGGLDLEWSNPSGADPGSPIAIEVNGVEVGSVAGTATSATVNATDLPAAQISEISVVNSTGLASSCTYPPAVTVEGFVKDWLLLGPLQQPAGLGWGAAPTAANIQRDFLSNADGSINEIDIEPKEGDTVDIDFGGAAASVGLAPAAGGNPNNINPGDVPTWHAWSDPDDTVNFDEYYGGNVDQIMMYGVTYICVEEEIPVDLCIGSDDAVQVLLDGVEIHLNSVSRAWGAANECLDVVFATDVPELNPLTAGVHKLMVKVFDGGGGHGFRLRFQDPLTLAAVVPGRITLNPDDCECEPTEPGTEVTCDDGVDNDCDGDVDLDDEDCDGGGGGFVRGDTNADGARNITDGVFVFSFLFTGGAEPPCKDAADTSDQGAINITSGIYILNFLFLGGPEPPTPFPDCGADPTPEGTELGCESFPPCEP